MDLFIRTPEPLDVNSYYTFLLFEPASFRATPDDILFSGDGTDIVDGGKDTDTISFMLSNQAIQAKLTEDNNYDSTTH